MKRYFFILGFTLSFFILSINSSGQNIDETINWLDMKFNEHARTEGNISYKYEFYKDSIRNVEDGKINYNYFVSLIVHVSYKEPFVNQYGGAYEILISPKNLRKPYFRNDKKATLLVFKYKDNRQFRYFFYDDRDDDIPKMYEYELQLSRNISDNEKKKIKKGLIHLIKLFGGEITKDLFE